MIERQISESEGFEKQRGVRFDRGIEEEKALLRARVGGAGSNLSIEEKARASAAACELLILQREWREARGVLLFAPMKGELDVWPLAALALSSGKRIGFPRYQRHRKNYTACQVEDLETEIKPGWYGIREPVCGCPELKLKPLDLILVPGVAFDLRGRRLGRGRGFYDQLLSSMPGIKCGVAFNEQIVEAVPVAPHDIHVNCILTPTRWVVF